VIYSVRVRRGLLPALELLTFFQFQVGHKTRDAEAAEIRTHSKELKGPFRASISYVGINRSKTAKKSEGLKLVQRTFPVARAFRSV
jgi:hypothetical protein